jgi:hypothetical protein
LGIEEVVSSDKFKNLESQYVVRLRL